MDYSSFTTEIDRLKDCYGDRAYPESRLRLMWNNFGQLSAEWLRIVVDGLISTAKFAPLPNDFYEPAAIERERLWKIEKEKNALNAKNFMQTYNAETIQTVCKAIVERMHGNTSDRDFNGFTKLLNEAPQSTQDCRACEGDGWIVYRVNSGDNAYRCFCADGNRKPRGIRQITYNEWKSSVA